MKAFFEKIKKTAEKYRRFLPAAIGVAAAVFLLLSGVFVFGKKGPATDGADNSATEEGTIDGNNDPDYGDIRVSVEKNGTRSGQLISDEAETDEHGRLYNIPRAVGQAEVNAAIASRAAAKASSKAESLSIEESERESSEEESRSIEESLKAASGSGESDPSDSGGTSESSSESGPSESPSESQEESSSESDSE